MMVNGLPFLITISRKLKFGTAEYLPGRKGVNLLNGIKNVQKVYALRGFKVKTLLMDGQFEPMRGSFSELGILLNTVSADEHVPDVERYIRTIKEHVRAIYNTLPFQKMPSRLLIEMVYSSVFWLNSFPANDGLSSELSPRTIITGMQLDFDKHCKLRFGSYVQTHEKHDNSMVPRTIGAIALRPTGNQQGGYYFFSLSTGRRLNRNRWTELPMPDDVIKSVVAMAKNAPANLEFTTRDGETVPDVEIEGEMGDLADIQGVDADLGDIDDTIEDIGAIGQNDDGFVPVVANHGGNPAIIAQNHPEGPEMAENGEIVAPEPNLDNNPFFPLQDDDIDVIPPDDGPTLEIDHQEPDIEPNPDNLSENSEIAGVEAQSEEIPGVQDPEDHVETTGVPLDASMADRSVNMPRDLQNLTDRHGNLPETRPTRTRQQERVNYDEESMFVTISDENGEEAGVFHQSDVSDAILLVTAQFNANVGLKMFKEKGEQAILKELKQLHDRGVIEPRKWDELTPEERKMALQYLMFLKEKRCGTIKARGCADGRSQRAYTPKEEASSPTVAIESVMISCTIDAREKRHVATVDLPGAFMQTDQDEVVHMKLQGPMAELVVRLDPKLYRPFIHMGKNKKPVLYVQLRKGLYGQLKAALMFWQNLSGNLQKWGFELNPYDTCVANSIINGKQCTILWHVDDLKISHEDYDVVTDIIEKLSKTYGKLDPITINRGKVHDYLGMTLDYNKEGKCVVKMVDYVKNMLNDLDEDIFQGEAATPASNHLFTVNEDNPEPLDDKKAEFFHHLVAKLLFLCKRARPDLQTAVAFLTTRVRAPDMDDYKKLARVMKYLRGTQELSLTLEADTTHVLRWWVDGSFAVHNDMKSHTGAIMSMGAGAIVGMSTKQKLNTTSSTEAELVAVNDAMPMIIWMRYFLEAQGYEIKDNIVYQDNQSAILLEKNGKASSSKRTKHINIRYFFIKDRISQKELKVVYCPTEEMRADINTKPLQGKAFYYHRDFIMNIQEDDPHKIPSLDHRSVLSDIDRETAINTVFNSGKWKNQPNGAKNEVSAVITSMNEGNRILRGKDTLSMVNNGPLTAKSKISYAEAVKTNNLTEKQQKCLNMSPRAVKFKI